MTSDDLVIASDNVRCIVSPNAGGRLSSIIAFGRELLITKNDETNLQKWGCYPMAPWAGRVRNGIFVHQSKQYQLEINMHPHAIHGTVLDRPWKLINSDSSSVAMKIDLGANWGFSGEATQTISVIDDVIEFHLMVETDDASMPAQVGWHPWFARPCTLKTDFSTMYLRDEFGIPTGEKIAPPVGPHDDCFSGSLTAPTLNFANKVQIVIQTDCSHWVVYDEPQHAICVEPQSGPPDGFNIEPLVITPDIPLTRFMRLVISEL
ncbi:MAG: aldose epimerase [Actinomycetota bacterium]